MRNLGTPCSIADFPVISKMMSGILQEKSRALKKLLPDSKSRQIVVLTGARQTGKTTLAKGAYQGIRYVNLDAPEEREIISNVRTSEWHKVVGSVVLDEAQKAPDAFEKVKYAYDAGDVSFSVLLGSSQILLLKNIRESLAGRASLYELFPLMLSELRMEDGMECKAPLFDKLCTGHSVADICEKIPETLLSVDDDPLAGAEDYLLSWGGMPALLPMEPAERWKWLKDYERTYLERDLADLARISDLQPFRRFQNIASLRSGHLLNYAELARDADISPDSAKRYLEYLRISYQAILLPPYRKNLTSTLVKSPKIYWVDCGLLRQASGFREGINGALYETMIVSEALKWIRTRQRDAELFSYRTRSGMEIDLLVQTRKGIVGVEIKSRNKVSSSDTGPLRELADALGSKWLGGLVVYRGNVIEKIGDRDIYTMPSRRLFG